MPKRSYDILADMSTDVKYLPAKIQKTERSHEENQERAYIAASRRADRSLEARVQSARMASDIHRKRTGRALKVSEEIVLKEEMYEEMEDDMPRSYKNLVAAHIQTESPELNHRVSAYIASQTAMATMAKYNEINKMFSEAFPQAANYSQQTQNSLYMSPLVNSHRSSSHQDSVAPSTSRHHSMSAHSHRSSMADNSIPSLSPDHTPSAISVPTPDLSPATTSTDATELVDTPYQMTQSAFPSLPLDPQLAQQPGSSFTSELPTEVKMMANIDMSDPMAMHLLGDNMSPSFSMPDEYGGVLSMSQLNVQESDSHDRQKSSNQFYESYFPSLDAQADFSELPPNNFAHFGAPGCGGPGPGIEAWESFVDFDTEQ
ncbi:hypothetical protein F4678DRAFT_347398 [Xylaria arbuscula]|nr:hypothetical protein F4678DRAFT_347398 [Xylaria arbuscula]